MDKPDIFPAAMLTDVTDPATKYSITFTLRDYMSYIDWLFSYILPFSALIGCSSRSLLIEENSDVQEHLDTDFARREQQTRTQSLLMCFGGERRLEVRLRRARGLMGRDERKMATGVATGRFRSNMAAREESSLSRDVNNDLNEGKLACQHRSCTVNKSS